jgi:hypothetical protein
VHPSRCATDAAKVSSRFQKARMPASISGKLGDGLSGAGCAALDVASLEAASFEAASFEAELRG